MAIDPKKIEERNLGRELARELLSHGEDYLHGELSKFPREVQIGFWRELLDAVPEFAKPSAVAPSELFTMTDSQAAEFERTSIEFGQYKGDAYNYVPISYLAWIADKALRLMAYLRSARGRRRIEAEEE